MNELVKIAVTADVGGFVSGMAKADGAIERVGVAMRSLAQIGKTLRNIGIAGVGMMAGWGVMAANFEGKMRNVNSLLELSAKEFAALSDQTRRMAAELPRSIGEAGEAMYDIVSSGFEDTAEASQVLEASLIAASAGLTNTQTSALALTTSINAYGMSVGQVSDISDTLFKTVDQGVIRFEELAVGMGDWAAMAAAAKVPLDEASAALATMTLSGISAAESSTSLARLLQQFVDPTEALVDVVKELGFETPQLMVQTLGLRGAMEKLRVVTGGEAAGMLELFDEIRASRGAFALIANEGQNYARVAGEIEDRSKRTGATQRALAEQAEGAGFKFNILKNQVQSLGIAFGNYLLPPAKLVMDHFTEMLLLLDRIPGPLKGIITLFMGLGSILLMVGGALIAWRAKAIVVQMGMSGVSMAMNGLAGQAGRINGVGPRLAAGLSNIGRAAEGSKGSTLRFGSALSKSVLNNFPRTQAAIRGISAAIGGLGGVLTLATAGLVMFEIMNTALEKNRAASKKWAEGIADDFDFSTTVNAREGLAGLRAELDKTSETFDKTFHGGWLDTLKTFGTYSWETLTPASDDVTRIGTDMEAMRQQVEIATMDFNNLAGAGEQVGRMLAGEIVQGTGRLNEQLEISDDVVQTLARSLGVDLTEAGVKNEDAFRAVADRLGEIFTAWGGLPPQLDMTKEEYAEFLEDMMEKTKKFLDDVASAFGGFNILEQFDQGFFEDKEKVFNLDAVGDYYTGALEITGGFIEDLRTAIEQGYDPQFIARLMTAGPQEAGAFLDTIVSDTKGKFRDLINGAESMLAELQGTAIEMARLVNLATGPTATDVTTARLPQAMQIQQLQFAAPDINYEQLRTWMGLTVEELDAIAAEYKITLPSKIATLDPALAAGEIQTLAQSANNLLGQYFSWDPRIFGHEYIGQIKAVANNTIRTYTSELDRNKTFTGAALAKALTDDYGFGGMKEKMKSEITAIFAAAGQDVPEAQVDVIVETIFKDELAKDLITGGMDVEDVAVLVSLEGTEDARTKLMENLELMDLTPTELITAFNVIQDQQGIEAVLNFVSEVTGVPRQDIQVNIDDEGMITFKADSAEAQEKLDVMNTTTYSPEVTLVNDQFMVGVDEMTTALRGLDGTVINLKINAPLPAGWPAAANAPRAPTPGQRRQLEEDGGILRFSYGTENHIAQFAKPGDWRVWAEPESGGEAYIPLSETKRPRSIDILGQVASMFGYRLAAYADGGIPGQQIGDVKAFEDLVGYYAGTKTTTKSFATAMWYAAAGVEAPDLTGITDAKERTARMAEYAKQQHEAILQVQLDMGRTYTEVAMAAGEAAADQLAASGLTGQAYEDAARQIIQAVDDQKKAEEDAAKEREKQAEEAEEARQKAIQDQRDMEDNMFHVGAIGKAQYLEILRARLVGFQQYSNDWTQVWDEIKQVEQEALDETNKAIEEATDKAQSLFDGFISSALSATSLVGQMAQEEFPTGAGILGFLDHMVQGTAEFNAVIQQLAQMGLDQTILKQLIETGPEALPFARELAKMDLNEVNAKAAALAANVGALGAIGTGIFANAAGPPTLNVNVGGIQVTINGVPGSTEAGVQAAVTTALNQAFNSLTSGIAQGVKS